jgi:hypothetical protein
MRKLTALFTVMAIVTAGLPVSPPVIAQTRVARASIAPAEKPVDAVALVASTIKAFPNGGEPLKLAITDLVVKNPNFAATVAVKLRNDGSLTAAQRDAVVAGLGTALNRLGIVAQVGGVSPMALALILGGAGLAGWGIYEATKDEGSTTSPN